MKAVIDDNNTDERLNENNDPAPLPLFGGRGYAVEVRDAQGGGDWDGLHVAEELAVGLPTDDYWLPLRAMDFCPFDAQMDASKILTCGAREAGFEVGQPGEPPNRQPALPNRFWDSQYASAPIDLIGRYNAANPGNAIDECRLACVQKYHCHTREGNVIPGGFGIAIELVHVPPLGGNPARTDVFVSNVDANGGVH